MRNLFKSAGRSRPARSSFLVACGAVALTLTVLPAEAYAQAAPRDVQAALKSSGKSARELRAFYEARDYRPLWINGTGLNPAAEQFLELVETADLDGLDRHDYRLRALSEAIGNADGGSPRALARAEVLLSQSFAHYVADLQSPREVGMVYADRELMRAPGTARAILTAAASAPSLLDYVEGFGWMHPLYGALRDGLADARRTPLRSLREEDLLRVNLERARALPAPTAGRHILVDAASARLWLYDNGRVQDSMKVVVGKPSDPTPMMAGLIRYTVLNPYWNIPPDLVRERIAPAVLKSGPSYIGKKGYEVLSDWTEDAEVVDPADVDWKAVAAGSEDLRVRQKPGRSNGMGKMKFMFPNQLGIYLHDTPDKDLFDEAERVFSAGCVRLEDAPRLARWLYGKSMKPESKAEQRVDLARPVPVYITYLTAMPEKGRIVFRDDRYDRDQALLAQLGGMSLASR